MDQPCFYRVSVKGIVIDEAGRVLLTREENGQWEILGGGLDHGEDPIEGLRREIREEAGLAVTKVSESPKYFITVPHPKGTHHFVNVIYEVELASLDFIPSEECQELRFFSPEEMATVPLCANVEALRKILAGEAKPAA